MAGVASMRRWRVLIVAAPVAASCGDDGGDDGDETGAADATTDVTTSSVDSTTSAQATTTTTTTMEAAVPGPYEGYVTELYDDPAVWICWPGADDICADSQDLTLVGADGARVGHGSWISHPAGHGDQGQADHEAPRSVVASLAARCSDGATCGVGRVDLMTMDGSAGVATMAATASGLTKVYGEGNTKVVALDHVDVGFETGKLTSIMGPSGSGKSTLLHCMAGLDTPTSGDVRIGDTPIATLDDKALTLLRRQRMGFIFQAFNLVPTLTAEENILLPLLLGGSQPDQEWKQRVVDSLGLGDRLTHRPAELSGGQQQRVAVARALVSRPDIIFADEPTGNLDSNSGQEVLGFMRRAVDNWEQTVVMVTHDPGAASISDRVIFLRDGALVGEILSPSADEILDQMRSLEA